MKYIVLIIAVIFICVFSNTVFAQEVTITVEDLKIFRQAQADAVSYKKQAEEAQAQSKKWESSSKSWQDQYLKEKHRADNVQGEAIKECDASKADLGKANFHLREQSREDKKKIGELEFDVRKYKSQRKWYFAAGAAAGAAGGTYFGYKAGKVTGIKFVF